MLKVVCFDVDIITHLYFEYRCKYKKKFPYPKEIRSKTYAFMASWAAAIRFGRLLYLGKREKVRANRERDGM